MATTVTANPTSAFSAVKVNIRLCGSVPRQEMDALSLTKCASVLSNRSLNTNSYLSTRCGDSQVSKSQFLVSKELSSQLNSVRSKLEGIPQRSAAPEFEAPTWAVPATGEARLEPICDSMDIQAPVDLTYQSVYRIGRSPQSDVQLLHATSSRKHAMLFHHSNGSCYLVDCGSAHGTYVNGVRVSCNPDHGVVIPHKVKRGSIIRFGGPGAPQFMLKSFAFDLEDMMTVPEVNPELTPTSGLGAVVQHNTRLNALGRTAKDSLYSSLTSKRSFESVETVAGDFDSKESRCSSPMVDEPEPVRLVSPDMNQPNKRRRVSFSSEPPKAFYPSLISPDLSSDENDDV
eukprot:Nitzschia sp. Nitz4//scaffold36_size144017//98549//99580//NITZ4_003105-RA/size144017-processed-gene-0.86-mRNA-1//-1//CDS//3329549513//7284//frame0